MGKMIKRRRKRIYNRHTFQAIILTFIAFLGYRAASSEGFQNLLKTSAQQQEVQGDLVVHYLDVGQGDCILLTCDGDAMLIDSGDNGEGEEIVDYLQYQGVDAIDYMVATHPDADHIGGMDTILKEIECNEVWMTEDKKDTKTYEEVIEVIEEKQIKKLAPKPKDSVSLGCATVTVLGPVNMDRDNVNNNSIVLRVTHGDESFLFAGDAEIEEMQDILDAGQAVDADVYKVSHHGSATGVNESFLEEVAPEYAVISCGEGNSYGHPSAAALNWLRSHQTAVFRTDEQGSIVAVSDGDAITWNCSPSESWQAGEAN